MARLNAAGLDRRSFLRGTAVGLAALPWVDVDALLPGVRRAASKVALIRASSRAEGVGRAMALLDPVGMAGKRVVLKPNFNSADGGPAGTHANCCRTHSHTWVPW